MRRNGEIFLILMLVAGCLPSTDPFVISMEKSESPLLKNIDETNLIRVDVAMLKLPMVERNLLESIWSMSDENAPGLEKKAILDQNGFKIVSFGKNPPSELLRLLSTEKYCPNPRRIHIQIGGKNYIPLTSVMDSLNTTLANNESKKDLNLLQAQAFLQVSPLAVSDNNYQLLITPIIKSGEEKLLPKAVKTVSGALEWEMHSHQAELLLSELTCDLKFEAGDFIVIGPSEKPNSELQKLGSKLFYTRQGQNVVPHLLVLRCSRKNPSLGAALGQFGPALPLAIQASWRNFEE